LMPWLALVLFAGAISGEDPEVGQQEPVESICFCAKLSRIWEGPVLDPLHLPTQAIPLKDGRLAVLDGANNRIVFFGVDGTFENHKDILYDSDELLDPVGFCTGPDNTLIVGDTGHARLVVLDDQGEFIESHELKGTLFEPRPTGVACDLEANRLFVTDRANGCLYLLELPGFEQKATFTLEADSDGTASFPLSPLYRNGELSFVEPVQGRIIHLNPDSGSRRDTGSFGMEPGELYRPKGLAMDLEGRIYCSDSLTGLIAVYTSSGGFLGWIGNSNGIPYRFEEPWSLCFDEEGRMIVVEMTVNRISCFELSPPVAVSPGPEITPAGAREMPDHAQFRKACFICHPDWLSEETALAPEGAQKGGNAQVEGSPRMCMSCHDGSVTESRSTAFAAHGHLEYAIEERSCMTCHQAHGNEKPLYEMEAAVFLRIPGPKGELCRLCHEAIFDKETGHGMGVLDHPFPPSLIRSGAAPPDSAHGPISCRTCHLAHGKAVTSLLVSHGREDTCRACHDAIVHDWEPHADLDRFDCLTCHSVHGSDRPGLLRQVLDMESRTCLHCHEDRIGIIGSSHQLESNEQACLACHGSFVRKGEAPDLWKMGKGSGTSESERRCLACHGRQGAARAVVWSAHRGELLPLLSKDAFIAARISGFERVDCATCHDPHAKGRAFLRPGVVGALCTSCHGPEGLYRFLNVHQAGYPPP
jgi:predicted CXXCH cytochrome family protein